MRALVRRLALLAGLCALACAALPSWAQALTASVTSGSAPLAGVGVTVEFRGDRRPAGASGTDGRVSINLTTLFGRPVPQREGIALSFTKPGFNPVNKTIFIAGAANELQVPMLADGSNLALSKVEQDSLKDYRTTTGTGPLMLLPYQLPGIPAGGQLNEQLRRSLERKIVTHVQSATGAAVSGLALRLLPIDGAHDLARMQAYGSYVNALAVVGGSGEKTADGRLLVSSSYVIIPKTGNFQPPIAFVDDSLAAGDIVDTPSLQKALKSYWGRVTLVAIAIRDINAAPAAPGAERKAALTRVRQYLFAEKTTAGQNNNDYIPQIVELIALLDKEIQQ